jgi:hypothetical protein
MKRTGRYPQGFKRPTCLADIVHRHRGWKIHTEVARKVFKTHYEGVWGPAMTFEESIAYDRLIVTNSHDNVKILNEKK